MEIGDGGDSPKVVVDYQAQADELFREMEERINAGWISELDPGVKGINKRKTIKSERQKEELLLLKYRERIESNDQTQLNVRWFAYSVMVCVIVRVGEEAL